MVKVVRAPFVVALSTGIATFRPGDLVDDAQYSAADASSIAQAGASQLSLLNWPAGPAVTAAQGDSVALRLRGGDPVGYFQATQVLMDRGYVVDHP